MGGLSVKFANEAKQFDGLTLSDDMRRRLNIIKGSLTLDISPGFGYTGIIVAMLALLNPLNHPITAACVEAERALARALDGSCQVPLAAYATAADGVLTLRGLVGSPDGSLTLQAEAEAPLAYADALGRAVAKKLADDGAKELIAALLATP